MNRTSGGHAAGATSSLESRLGMVTITGTVLRDKHKVSYQMLVLTKENNKSHFRRQ